MEMVGSRAPARDPDISRKRSLDSDRIRIQTQDPGPLGPWILVPAPRDRTSTISGLGKAGNVDVLDRVGPGCAWKCCLIYHERPRAEGPRPRTERNSQTLKGLGIPWTGEGPGTGPENLRGRALQGPAEN